MAFSVELFLILGEGKEWRLAFFSSMRLLLEAWRPCKSLADLLLQPSSSSPYAWSTKEGFSFNYRVLSVSFFSTAIEGSGMDGLFLSWGTTVLPLSCPSVGSAILKALLEPSALCSKACRSDTVLHTGHWHPRGPCSSCTFLSFFSCLVSLTRRNKGAITGPSARVLPASACSSEIT